MSSQKVNNTSYSISEVSQLTGLKSYVLRYWETEFKTLKPKKNSAGNRKYCQDDIKLILFIKKLLYDEKYTIEGARQRLGTVQKKSTQMDLSFDKIQQEDLVYEVKKELHSILNLLNKSINRQNPIKIKSKKDY